MSQSNESNEQEAPSENQTDLNSLAADTSPSDDFMNLQIAIERSQKGISTLLHELDQTVTFMLDNHKEVVLRVRKIDIEYVGDEVITMRVHCRTDFENVLILAKKLKMRISAFAAFFSVVLSTTPEFVEDYNDEILAMDHPAKFFETLDELKRPIFLNLNHYIVARISD